MLVGAGLGLGDRCVRGAAHIRVNRARRFYSFHGSTCEDASRPLRRRVYGSSLGHLGNAINQHCKEIYAVAKKAVETLPIPEQAEAHKNFVTR